MRLVTKPLRWPTGSNPSQQLSASRPQARGQRRARPASASGRRGRRCRRDRRCRGSRPPSGPRLPWPAARPGRWRARQDLGDDRCGRSARTERQRPAPAVEVVDGGPQLVVDPLPVGPVVVAHQRQPDRHRVHVAVAQRRDEDQVAPRLRHLLAVVADHAAVAVDLRERRPGTATCAWPAHISWCGKTRSLPPPWTSKAPPRCSCAIAVHSMCQPGRPGPHGLGHEGSPSRSPRHTTQSSGSFLPGRSGSPPRSGIDLEHLLAGPPRLGAERRVGGHGEVEVVLDAVDRRRPPRGAGSGRSRAGSTRPRRCSAPEGPPAAPSCPDGRARSRARPARPSRCGPSRPAPGAGRRRR